MYKIYFRVSKSQGLFEDGGQYNRYDQAIDAILDLLIIFRSIIGSEVRLTYKGQERHHLIVTTEGIKDMINSSS